MEKIVIGLVFGILIIGVIITTSAIIIKLYIKKIKEHSAKELEFQKKLNLSVLQTQEIVLNNIASELHDDFGQQLTVVNFQLEAIKLESCKLQTILEPISLTINNLSANIRDLSHALSNTTFSGKSLETLIGSEVIRLQKIKQVHFNFEFKNPNNLDIDINEKILLYRAFQEAINNALKHSKAKKINVLLNINEFPELIIQDNGVGFENKNGFGLNNLKDKVAQIGYKLITENNLGTCLTLKKQN